MFILLLIASCRNRSGNATEEIKEGSSQLDSNKADNASQYADSNLNPVDSQVYRQRTVYDTTFAIDNNLFKVSVKTDFDSTKKIIVPKKYVSNYGINNFEVFESYTKLKIRKNNELIVDTSLSKKGFSNDLDQPLLKYGNLMFPEVTLQNRTIEINHSISIPMTDIGVPVSSRFEIK